MEDAKQYPTVLELVKMYDKGELEVTEGKIYKCRMTENHTTVGFMYSTEIPHWSNLNKDIQESQYKAMWYGYKE